MAALQKTSTSNLPGIGAKSTIIIGLSGGPDSVYLLHRLVEMRDELGLTLFAAHLDHEWRPTSTDDAQFCASLCAYWKVPLISKKASELGKAFIGNGSQEQLGRNMRRFFLEEVKKECNANFIALAHHQDDQIETFFINLIRGTGLAGLGGMKEADGTYIRPLLHLTKQDILEYLKEHQIHYQIDPTNTSDAYLRNRIRAAVIPALSTCDARALHNIPRTMQHAQETELFLQTITKQTLTEILDEDEQSLDLTKFFALDRYLQKRVIKTWLECQVKIMRSSQAYIDEVIRFLESPQGGKHQIAPGLILSKKSQKLSLIPSL